MSRDRASAVDGLTGSETCVPGPALARELPIRPSPCRMIQRLKTMNQFI